MRKLIFFFQPQTYNHHQLTTAKKILEMASEMTGEQRGSGIKSEKQRYKSLFSFPSFLPSFLFPSDVDFPVCGDCLDGLLAEYKSLARQVLFFLNTFFCPI